MNKDELDNNDIVLESGFAFKAEKLEYQRKGKKKANLYTNRKKDITESKYYKNLRDTVQENTVYEQVEKHSEKTLRVIE